jgi:hypothetical protein
MARYHYFPRYVRPGPGKKGYWIVMSRPYNSRFDPWFGPFRIVSKHATKAEAERIVDAKNAWQEAEENPLSTTELAVGAVVGLGVVGGLV